MAHAQSHLPGYLLAVVFVQVCSMHAHAQTASAGVTCEVIAPSAIEQPTELSFGDFSAVHGGTVTIGVDGARTSTGAVVLVASDIEQTSARIDVRGDGSSSFSVTLPVDTTASRDDGTGREMTVQFFSTSASDLGRSTDGAWIMLVGATLTIAAEQTPGTYVGRYAVTVEYN